MHNRDLGARRASLSPAKRALLERRAREAGSGPSPAKAIPKRADGGPAPLSFAQQRLWFIDQLQPGSPAYNIPMAFWMNGALDVGALARSFAEVFGRHEVLRTVFINVEGEPRQVVRQEMPGVFSVVDLRELGGPAQAAESQSLAARDAGRPFDLTRGPLLRLTLLLLGEQRQAVLLTMHHIISDAWSIDVLVAELAAAYEAFAGGSRPALKEPEIQYGDYAVWQRQVLQGDELQRHLDYWRQKLGGRLPQLALPTDRARPPRQTLRGAYQGFNLSADLSERVRSLARAEGVTLFVVLLSAFFAFLHRATGQDDLIVGTDIANRNRKETEGLIGYFINQLALRTALGDGPTFLELLRRVNEVVLAAYSHAEVPFDKLVEELQPQRDPSRNAIFQVLFVLQNVPVRPLRLPGMRLEPMACGNATAKFDLALFMTDGGGGLAGVWNYSTDLFEAATVARFTRNFEALLDSAAANPAARLTELRIWNEEEMRQQAMERNQRKEEKFKRFISVRPQAVNLAETELVKTRYLGEGERLPLVIEPAGEQVDVVDWAKGNLAYLERELLAHGAVLFRGFAIQSAAAFEKLAAAVCGPLYGEYGDLPREEVAGKVYAATPYPSNKAILFHNESSHLSKWPLRIWFYCVKAAARGGETPLVDCRRMYTAVPAEVVARLEQKQIMYVRNFIPGLDVSWESFFKTTDRGAVEQACRAAGMQWEWRNGNTLRIGQVRPAVTRHAVTGEKVFFNQVQLHHPNCLDPDVRQSLIGLYGKDGLPRNVCYGDGSEIEDDVIETISAAYRWCAISNPWQPGDVLMIDNMLVAHGRNPYEGERKIVVAMGRMTEEGCALPAQA